MADFWYVAVAGGVTSCQSAGRRLPVIAESVMRATRSRFWRPAQKRELARLGTKCPFTDNCANRPLNGAFRSDCKGFCIYLM
jgi:hypothetical protein